MPRALVLVRRPLLVVTLSVPSPSPQRPGPAKSNGWVFFFGGSTFKCGH